MADPYVIDWPAVAGNVAQTIANLTALQTELMTNPKPSYNVHGHQHDWAGLYKLISDQIDASMRQLSRMEPFEEVSIGW